MAMATISFKVVGFSKDQEIIGFLKRVKIHLSGRLEEQVKIPDVMLSTPDHLTLVHTFSYFVGNRLGGRKCCLGDSVKEKEVELTHHAHMLHHLLFVQKRSCTSTRTDIYWKLSFLISS